MNTLGLLSKSIRADIWASHEAEQLVTPHHHAVIEAIGEIQKWVECEQSNNANVIRFCNTFVKCGMTIVEAPKGMIRRVYTIEDDWCDPVYYRQATLKEVQCFQLADRTYEEPTNEGQPAFPLGFKKAEDTTDVDAGRARCGVFAIHKGNLYLSPWIQSTESVVIEWDGIKDFSAWSDEDPVSDAIDFRKAVKLYVQYCHERDYGDIALARTIHDPSTKTGTYDEALGDLMFQCREQTRIRKSETCPTEAECHCGPYVWSALQSAGITGGPVTTKQRVFGGVGNPNGVQDAPIYSIYNEVDANGDYFRTWVKTTAEGSAQGWQ